MSLLFRIPEGTPETTCRSCRAPVAWVPFTKKDGTPSKMIVDLDLAEEDADGVLRGPSHWASCPDAADWKGKGKSKRAAQ